LDMCILLTIQFANASISFYEITKAGNAVAALKSSLKATATCKRDGRFQVLDASLLVPGDTVLLASGSAVPADCRINESTIDVDQSALTGESLPVSFYQGDSVKMGSTVVRGEVQVSLQLSEHVTALIYSLLIIIHMNRAYNSLLQATVEFTGSNTFFGKTATLLQDSHEPSHLQKLLITIMYVLVILSFVLCMINFFYLIGQGADFRKALSFTIVLLVASIPLAIEIVTTTTLAIGSKQLVKYGAIVAKLSAIEDLAGMSILCSDKTGTMTLNQMVLQDNTPIYCHGENQESTLMFAAMAAKWNEPPRDALDRLTLGSVNRTLLENFEQIDYMPFDPLVKRTEGTVRNKSTGETFRTSKGAPPIILSLLPPSAQSVRDAVEKDVARLGEKGIRSLAVARSKSDSGPWEMIGLLTFLDPPRPDTILTIQQANSYGVQVKMITGDHLLIARNTALQLEMGDKIFTADRLPLLDPDTRAKPEDLGKNYGDLCLVADGFAQVYPEHKYLIVECFRELGYVSII
jgi:H+-transporting ATPase